MLVLFLEVVALLDHQVDFLLDLYALFLVLPCLASLFVEPLLEQVNLRVNLLLLAHDFFELSFLRYVITFSFLDLPLDLVSVLEVHVSHLTFCSLDLVHCVLGLRLVA